MRTTDEVDRHIRTRNRGPRFRQGQQFLPQSDVDAHTRLGISPDILTRAQVRRVDDREARDVLGKSHSKPGYFDGVEYPI